MAVGSTKGTAGVASSLAAVPAAVPTDAPAMLQPIALTRPRLAKLKSSEAMSISWLPKVTSTLSSSGTRGAGRFSPFSCQQSPCSALGDTQYHLVARQGQAGIDDLFATEQERGDASSASLTLAARGYRNRVGESLTYKSRGSRYGDITLMRFRMNDYNDSHRARTPNRSAAGAVSGRRGVMAGWPMQVQTHRTAVRTVAHRRACGNVPADEPPVATRASRRQPHVRYNRSMR